jgi:transcriptional regulator with PAS, ATPase and Fis domain
MLTSVLPSTAAGQAALLASLVFAAFVLVTILHGRLRLQNKRLLSAIDNMSQGLCMFDGQARIVVNNRRYIDMYRLSSQIVRPGCTLRELIKHRKDTGLFSGDVKAYCQKIIDDVRSGESKGTYVQASDGRIVLAKNEPLPGGGRVSTHDDVTEQRHAKQERAAIRDQEQRHATIDSAITSFRPTVEKLLSAVSASANAMRSTAHALFGSSNRLRSAPRVPCKLSTKHQPTLICRSCRR